jgi:hypothetical protein
VTCKVVKGTDTTKDDVRAFKKYVCKEFNGKGDITFEDGAKYTVNFDIYIFNSGGLAGSILFTTIDSRLDDELNRSQIFTVSGEAQNSNGLMISAEQCTFYSINTIENNVSIPLITGNFKITRLKVYDDKKIKKIDEPESTKCYLTLYHSLCLQYSSFHNFLLDVLLYLATIFHTPYPPLELHL